MHTTGIQQILTVAIDQWWIQRGFHGFHGTPLLKGCVRKYYLYESTYFPTPYADNQLLCSLCGPKWSHAINSVGFKHNNQAQQQVIQLLQFHPKNTPETISEGPGGWWVGGMPPAPLASALCALFFNIYIELTTERMKWVQSVPQPKASNRDFERKKQIKKVKQETRMYGNSSKSSRITNLSKCTVT